MTTTDANGIVFLEETDDISPFHTLINGLQSATSAAIENSSAGLILQSSSSTIATSTSTTWVTQSGHSSSFTVPRSGSRNIEVVLSAVLNGQAINSSSAARVLIDGATVVASVRATHPVPGSAGRFQLCASDLAVLSAGSHTVAVQVQLTTGGTGADLVASTLTIWDRGGA